MISEPLGAQHVERRSRAIKVLHIITGLEVGGAETMLFKLLGKCEEMGTMSEVLSLKDAGPIGARILTMGVPVHTLDLGSPAVGGFAACRRVIRSVRPDVVHTWMYHANLLGGLAARSLGIRRIVWGIRSADAFTRAKPMTKAVIRACQAMSRRIPAQVVFCSERARDLHCRSGYPADRCVVIPNGFDLGRFQPDDRARANLRAELGLSPDSVLVGLIARFHPDKDHQNFVDSAKRAIQIVPDLHFVLAGSGCAMDNIVLRGWISEAGLASRFHLLGRRDDVERLTAALDMAVLSSATEAFPNVVGEAMACGVPCAVTDVGDAAAIVGDTGLVVPPKDPEALGAGIAHLASLGSGKRRILGERARARIEQNFELGAVARHYRELYERLVKEVVR
ncbi:MAG TPA: glycosyltransferase [Fimbriimonadaceae bacterium]|nr:glycosyltransferase [Fimbriimonadaceae bacterium]